MIASGTETGGPVSGNSDWLTAFIGQVVVCDLDDHFLVIGTLVYAGPDHFALANADLHDHREANSTREVYVIESRKIGVRVNRHKVWVPRSRVVAVSLLDDVVM